MVSVVVGAHYKVNSEMFLINNIHDELKGSFFQIERGISDRMTSFTVASKHTQKAKRRQVERIVFQMQTLNLFCNKVSTVFKEPVWLDLG